MVTVKYSNVAKVPEPPHFRGAILFQGWDWPSSYLDRGSFRLIPVALSPRPRLGAFTLFTYGSAKRFVVSLVTPSHRHRALRLYVKTCFPYLTLNPSAAGVYKCLHFFLGFVMIGTSSKLEIAEEGQAPGHAIVAIKGVVGHSQSTPDMLTSVHQLCSRATKPDLQEVAETVFVLRAAARGLAKGPERDALSAAEIRLSAKALVNHRASHKSLKRLVNNAKARGETAFVGDFQAELARLTYPLMLARHGYNLAFANLDLTVVAAELNSIMHNIKRLGVEPFLNSGTLLGYFRDGRPIIHDDDFDLGLWLPGETEEEVASKWHLFKSRIEQFYPVIDKGSFLAIRMSNGVQIDLFPCWTREGKTYVFPYCYGDCNDTTLRPLKKLTVSGQDFAVPACPEALLAVNYGPNWRVPDPFWRFDYKLAKRRFGKVMKRMKATHPPNR
jgi:hypothetical protein